MNITEKNTQIIVCCHKACKLPNDSLLLPVHVGASLSNLDLAIQRDDMVNDAPCDNISSKNESYCELTGMYWAWRNLPTLVPGIEFIGINHYRRYFRFTRMRGVKSLFVLPEKTISDYRVERALLAGLLNHNDVVAPTPIIYPYSLFNDYSICHISEDMRILVGVLHSLNPGCDKAVYDVLFRSNSLMHYNMGIMRWSIFDRYCSWLFEVLREVEQRVHAEHYGQIQKRVFGYMAERLWNVWLAGEGLKVTHLPVCQYADDVVDESVAKAAANIVRKELAFRLSAKSKKGLIRDVEELIARYSLGHD